MTVNVDLPSVDFCVQRTNSKDLNASRTMSLFFQRPVCMFDVSTQVAHPAPFVVNDFRRTLRQLAIKVLMLSMKMW